METMTAEAIVKIITNFGIIPAGFLILILYFARQVRDLQKQNEKLLSELISLVRELIKPDIDQKGSGK